MMKWAIERKSMHLQIGILFLAVVNQYLMLTLPMQTFFEGAVKGFFCGSNGYIFRNLLLRDAHNNLVCHLKFSEKLK